MQVAVRWFWSTNNQKIERVNSFLRHHNKKFNNSRSTEDKELQHFESMSHFETVVLPINVSSLLTIFYEEWEIGFPVFILSLCIWCIITNLRFIVTSLILRERSSKTMGAKVIFSLWIACYWLSVNFYVFSQFVWLQNELSTFLYCQWIQNAQQNYFQLLSFEHILYVVMHLISYA